MKSFAIFRRDDEDPLLVDEKPLFVAEIDAHDSMSIDDQARLAVLWAKDNGISLSQAYLHGINFEGADLSGCNFSGADLRNVVLDKTDLRNADLRYADLSGSKIRDADLRGANLSLALLKDADLSRADLRNVDLSGTELSWASLPEADLRGADLDAQFTNADLRGVKLSDEIPVIPNIHKALYEVAEREGEPDMLTKENDGRTSQLRAERIIALSGQPGQDLEKRYDTATAAGLIYIKSDPALERVPDFYCTYDEALADIKRRAGEGRSWDDVIGKAEIKAPDHDRTPDRDGPDRD